MLQLLNDQFAWAMSWSMDSILLPVTITHVCNDILFYTYTTRRSVKKIDLFCRVPLVIDFGNYAEALKKFKSDLPDF